MLGSVSQIKPWLDLAYRRRYWIIIPALLGLVGGAVVLSQMPKIYEAQTTITWKQQTIPPNYVPTTVSTGVLDRLAILQVSMLSRPSLEPIAREFGLIKPGAKGPEIEAAVGRLAMSVIPEVDVMRPPKFFRIRVHDANPKLASQVANRLANRIVEENSSIRLKEAEQALETARKFKADLQRQLEAREKQIAEYQSGKLWQMPQQLGANMQLLNTTTMRIQAIDSEIAGIRNQIGIARMNPAQVPVTSPGAPALDPVRAGYEQLKRELADLQLRGYTDAHPDVRAKRSQVEAYAKANPQVLAPPPAPSTGDTAPTGASPMEIQIAGYEAQIKKLERDKANLEAQLGEYQGRINSTPNRQQEMDELTRGMVPLQQQFDQWVAKETDAQRFLDLERAKQGEQFEVQARAWPPTVPYSPVPWQVILAGLGVGLALGIGISLLFEFLDNSVRTEEEFLTAFPELPLLASIPDLDRAVRRRRRKSSSRRRAA